MAMGNVIGYARVSTRGQSRQDCLKHFQPGNVVAVTDLTRLGRSPATLAAIVTTP
jgi:DNA invertase Pin-like site-specific DNA recombinase